MFGSCGQDCLHPVALQRWILGLCALLLACGTPDGELPEAGGSCSTAGALRCAQDGDKHVREGCHHGLWALYEFCADSETCEDVGGLGPTCVSDTNELVVPCATVKHDCADGNACTRDECTVGGCRNFPLGKNMLCDDGDVCTTGDRCSEQVGCTGDTRTCEDGDPCTTDSCTPKIGCAHTPIADCSTCKLPGPDGKGSGAVTLRITSMRPAGDKACDVDQDGKPDDALGEFWDAVHEEPGNSIRSLSSGTWMPLLRVAPAVGMAGFATMVQWLDGHPDSCLPGTSATCTALALAGSYQKVVNQPGTCRAGFEAAAVTTGGGALWTPPDKPTSPSKIRIPVVDMCPTFGPALAAAQGVAVFIEPIPDVAENAPAGGYSVRICGSVLRADIIAATTATNKFGCGGSEARLDRYLKALPILLKADLDLDTSGGAEAKSFGILATAERVSFGGAK